MTPRTVRRAERVAHLFWGGTIVLYVYGLLPPWGEPVVRWLVIPALAASGFAMWFAAPIRRLWKRLRPGSPPMGREHAVTAPSGARRAA